jgi:hypothetical protein
MNKASIPTDYTNKELLNESGRTWTQWFSEMQSKGFDEISVIDMSRRLTDDYKLDEPCARIIALRFCQHIGKCEITDTASVFEVSVSKTFNYPISEVYNRATDWLESENWAELQERINSKRLNCKWLSDNSMVGVKFQSKGEAKTKMVVQHERLESKTDADIMRNFWKRSISNMIETL